MNLKVFLIKNTSSLVRLDESSDLRLLLENYSFFIARRPVEGGVFEVYSSKSVNHGGRALMVFPDKESARIRCGNVEVVKVKWSAVCDLLGEAVCDSLVLSMGNSWVEVYV